MSISDEITRIKTNISNAHAAAVDKGTTFQGTQNSDNLPNAIRLIPGSTTTTRTIDAIFVKLNVPNYTEVEYITSEEVSSASRYGKSSAWINLNSRFSIGTDKILEISMSIEKKSKTCVSIRTASTRMFYISQVYDSSSPDVVTVRCGYYGDTNYLSKNIALSGDSDTINYKANFSTNQFYINGVLIGAFPQLSEEPTYLILLGDFTGSIGGGGTYYYYPGNINGLQVKSASDEQVLFCLVPCTDGSMGTLWEIVNNAAPSMTVRGSNFTAGPEVT